MSHGYWLSAGLQDPFLGNTFIYPHPSLLVWERISKWSTLLHFESMPTIKGIQQNCWKQEKGWWNLNSSGNSLIPSSPWSPINSTVGNIKWFWFPFPQLLFWLLWHLQTIFPMVIITFPLFPFSVYFQRKKKSHNTAKEAKIEQFVLLSKYLFA